MRAGNRQQPQLLYRTYAIKYGDKWPDMYQERHVWKPSEDLKKITKHFFRHMESMCIIDVRSSIAAQGS